MRVWHDVAQLRVIKSVVGMSVKASLKKWHLSQVLKNMWELAKETAFQPKGIACEKVFKQKGT